MSMGSRSFQSQQRHAVGAGAIPGVPVSASVTAGGLIFVSAVTGRGPAGTASEDVGYEVRQALGRLKSSLEAAGSSLEQAVAINVYLKRAADFDAMNAAYREVFVEKPPVRTTVAVDLPGGALVSLSAIAVPAGAPRETLHPAGWVK